MPTQTLLPDVLLAHSEWAGSPVVATIDEDPDTAGGDWLDPVTASGSGSSSPTARVGFPTPTGNPSGVQTFKARLGLTVSGGTAPTARIDLYENGALKASGAAQTISTTKASAGQVISQAFDLATTPLTTANGSGVEALVVVTASGGKASNQRSASLDSVNWDTANYSVAAVASTLTDDFNDGTIDAAKWTADNAGVVETGGRLQMTVASATFMNLTSTSTYTLADSSIHVEVPQRLGGPTSTTGLAFRNAAGDNAFRVETNVGDGVLYFVEVVAGVYDGTSVGWDATAHRWWRIRHNNAAGQVYWETSPDGVTWTIRRQKAPAATLSGNEVRLVAGYGGTDGTVTAQFDNLNVAATAADTTPPVTTLGTPTRTTISRVPPYDFSDVTITTDEAFVEYELRRVPAETSTRTEGGLIETAVVAATTSLTATITDDELIAAGGAEGENIVKGWTRDAAGNWSTSDMAVGLYSYPSPQTIPRN